MKHLVAIALASYIWKAILRIKPAVAGWQAPSRVVVYTWLSVPAVIARLHPLWASRPSEVALRVAPDRPVPDDEDLLLSAFLC